MDRSDVIGGAFWVSLIPFSAAVAWLLTPLISGQCV